MQKAFRVIISLITGLVLLGIIAAVAIVSFINPNDFKPQITSKFQEKTGRELTLNGDIHWSFFPSVGLQLNDVKIGNAPGFGNQTFAQAQKVDVQVELLPLLHKELNIGKITLEGFDINLVKNKKGQTNWQSFSAAATTPATKTSTPTSPAANTNATPAAFFIAGINVMNGHISYTDEQTNSGYDITNLQIKTASITTNKSFPLDIQFNLLNKQSKTNTALKISSEATLDTAQQTYRLDDFKLNATSPNQLDATLTANILANLRNETATINNLSIAYNQMKFTGNLKAQKILNSPIIQGHLQTNELKLGKFVFSNLNTDIKVQNDVINLNPITATIYQGSYTGNISIDLYSSTPKFISNVSLRNIQAESLFRDLTDITHLQVSGLANFDTHLATSGTTQEAIVKNLNGRGNFNLNNGALKGVDISYWVEVGKALIHKQAYNGNNTNETRFDTLNGSFVINNGIVQNNNLILESSRMRITGKGSANLVSQSIDYNITAQPTNAQKQLQDIPITLKVSGLFSHVTITPMIEELIKDVAKQQLNAVIGDQLQKSLGKEVGKQLQNQLQQLFK